jgi:hypothetical protein
MSNSRSTQSIKRVSEKSLKEGLRKKVLIIVAISVAGIMSLFVFAPQVGYLFGFLSKHRNDPGYIPTPKPMPPVFIGAPESTNQDKINLSGNSLAGSLVKIYVNGPERGQTVTGSDGMFSFVDIQLNSGTNTIFAKSFDDRGNESDSSRILTIKKDKDEPKIQIESPDDGETIKNLNKTIQVTGKINEKATITVNGNPAIQKPDLTFDYYLKVENGDVEIKVEAQDEAGNKSATKVNVKYYKGQ